jgi:hypothetical protein
MHKILVIRLYFLLDALHVSDYINPSSGAGVPEENHEAVESLLRHSYTKIQISCTAMADPLLLALIENVRCYRMLQVLM